MYLLEIASLINLISSVMISIRFESLEWSNPLILYRKQIRIRLSRSDTVNKLEFVIGVKWYFSRKENTGQFKRRSNGLHMQKSKRTLKFSVKNPLLPFLICLVFRPFEIHFWADWRVSSSVHCPSAIQNWITFLMGISPLSKPNQSDQGC